MTERRASSISARISSETSAVPVPDGPAIAESVSDGRSAGPTGETGSLGPGRSTTEPEASERPGTDRGGPLRGDGSIGGRRDGLRVMRTPPAVVISRTAMIAMTTAVDTGKAYDALRTVTRSLTTFDEPPGCMVTPYRQSAASIVRF